MSALRDDRAKFEAAGAAVFGVNPASAESHRDFDEALGLGFPLIVDGDRELARAFEALREDGQGIERTTVIIDRAGTVIYREPGLFTTDDLLRVLASRPAG